MPYGHESGKQTYKRQAEVVIGDGYNLDSFSRVRTSDPTTIFESRFQYHLHPLFFSSSTANGATITHDADMASADMSLDGTADGSAILQSKAYSTYSPGKSHLVIMTGILGSATASVVKRMGYFDSLNGIFIEQNGTTDVAFVKRTSVSGSPVDNRVVQASWNLDPLDGSGPSGETLDLSKTQILIVDMQWLGSGRVRVGFDIGGQMVYCHEFLHANVLTTPYMTTGTLPVRWEITGDAADTMYATCSTVQSEGGAELGFGHQLSYKRSSLNAGSGAQTHAFSIRKRVTYNGVVNRQSIIPVRFTCLVTGNFPVLLEIYYGTSVAGASWANINTTHSGLEVDTAGTPSGGVEIDHFWIDSTASGSVSVNHLATQHHPLALNIDGDAPDGVITVYVTGIGGVSACRPGFVWEEVR